MDDDDTVLVGVLETDGPSSFPSAITGCMCDTVGCLVLNACSKTPIIVGLTLPGPLDVF